MSVLPECIAPLRWYPWELQQLALLLLLSGRSIYRVSCEVIPSRHTIARWLKRFKEQYPLHRDSLVAHCHALSCAIGFDGFWTHCLGFFMPLSSAMRLCQTTGGNIP